MIFVEAEKDKTLNMQHHIEEKMCKLTCASSTGTKLTINCSTAEALVRHCPKCQKGKVSHCIEDERIMTVCIFSFRQRTGRTYSDERHLLLR